MRNWILMSLLASPLSLPTPALAMVAGSTPTAVTMTGRMAAIIAIAATCRQARVPTASPWLRGQPGTHSPIAARRAQPAPRRSAAAIPAMGRISTVTMTESAANDPR